MICMPLRNECLQCQLTYTDTEEETQRNGVSQFSELPICPVTACSHTAPQNLLHQSRGVYLKIFQSTGKPSSLLSITLPKMFLHFFLHHNEVKLLVSRCSTALKAQGTQNRSMHKHSCSVSMCCCPTVTATDCLYQCLCSSKLFL